MSRLRIIVGSYMIRYPLGGMLSWSLQWLVGLLRLGHDVYFAETAAYAGACFDPRRRVNTDDPGAGLQAVVPLLERFGMKERWVYSDVGDRYHGMTPGRVRELFDSADLFIDLGTHGAWQRKGLGAKRNVVVDGEPGYTQIKLEKLRRSGEALPEYDAWFTNGALVGNEASRVPTAGLTWRHVFNPVVPDLFPVGPVGAGRPFRTVMNWQSHPPIEFDGRSYGQKDVEFRRFVDLPRRTRAPLEVAVGGKKLPLDELRQTGWRIADAIDETETFDSFLAYIAGARGEWSVCKNIFVAMKTGWFSDRSAAFLASGRPVALQETGFSSILPCGEGLFAFGSPAGAVDAIDAIEADWERHSAAAAMLSREYLAADKVLPRFLDEAVNTSE